MINFHFKKFGHPEFLHNSFIQNSCVFICQKLYLLCLHGQAECISLRNIHSFLYFELEEHWKKFVAAICECKRELLIYSCRLIEELSEIEIPRSKLFALLYAAKDLKFAPLSKASSICHF